MEPPQQSSEGLAPDQPSSATPVPAASSGRESTPAVAAVASPSGGAGLGFSCYTPVLTSECINIIPYTHSFLHVIRQEKLLGSYLSIIVHMWAHGPCRSWKPCARECECEVGAGKAALGRVGDPVVLAYIVDRFVIDMDVQFSRYKCLRSSWPMKHELSFFQNLDP